MMATMSAWETEDEYAKAAQASLPTPTDTPYRTPSRQSRQSSRQKSMSPGPSSSPPLPNSDHNSRRNSKDITNDESISILDPRRFTPTLHANLVSEILALRRDQEEKTKFIENLESSLHIQRGEFETVTATLSATAKESRSLKRQLALLEGGTSSALGELARERDEAVESVAEIKKRLETAQKKIRSQEENADRVHELWARDKDNWEDEKRKYERKIHVAEGRLRTVLDEVATYQSSHHPGQHNGEAEAEVDSGVGHGSDAGSVRSMSLTNSVRFSMLNGPNGYGVTKTNGISLADELDLDEEEEEPQTDNDGRESVMSLARLHRRNTSRDSLMSRTHRRNQSIDSLRRPGSVARGRIYANQAVLDKLQGNIIESDETAKFEYVDTGVQYSPPPSPELKAVPTTDVAKPERLSRQSGGSSGEWEIEANQRRKRVHANPIIIEHGVNGSVTSSESQTVEDPLSPPRTPKSPVTASQPQNPRLEMTSQSTQTDIPLPELVKPVLAASIPIPQISIHPPTSRPQTPREPLLPQHFKDAGCQVSMQSPVPTRSTSVQTEEIRVDKRINLLPKHLQPSTISSNPPSPEPRMSEKRDFSPVPPSAMPVTAPPPVPANHNSGPPVALPPRNPRRMRSQKSMPEIPSSPPLPVTRPISQESHDAYPGNNDDGPLANNRGSLRRPHRSSSLFAGFDTVSSDEADDFGDADLSDNDFRTALSAPKPKTVLKAAGKRLSSPPTSVPEDVEPVEEKRPRHVRGALRQNGNYDSNGVFTLPDAPQLPAQRSFVKQVVHQMDRQMDKHMDKPLTLVTTATTAKTGTMRRAALIQNGIAAHQGRSRSPSFPEPVKEPPFPIPTRASSRKPPFSVSAPSEGNRSPTRDPWNSHLRRGPGRGHIRVNSIRKVRSAAALPGNSQRYRRHGSRSPPPLSASTEAPESPTLPPMPNNDITSPDVPHNGRLRGHRQQTSTNTANTTSNNSVGSAQATSVVDAIAQTMVGEWMFKYVRRRKSFGVPQNNGMDENGVNGERHKRWVWLAPYERAVMWSSKQPTSGSALMGKSGRKLVIQSVLDVKDDNPAPKGVGTVFNRSILILTPARALKFTATTKERHYLWLTALSFLAHSSQAVPDVMSIPPPPQQIPEYELPRQPTRLRKNAIRDSIRVAKGKTPAYGSLTSRSGAPSVTSSHQGGEFSIRTDASTRTGPATSDIGGSIKDLGNYFTPPDAADPPVVPRFSDRAYPGSHGRKRSNTGSRIPPPLSFRGFSERGPLPPVSSAFNSNGGGSYGSSSNSGHGPSHGHAPSTAGVSVGTNGSSDIYNQSQQSSSVAGYPSGRSSIRTSDASGRPSAVFGNFFDAVGTMRMEAFISPMNLSRFDDYPDEMEEVGMVSSKRRISRDMTTRRRSKSRDRRRSRNRNSYYSTKSREEIYGSSKTAGEEEYDPFRGF